MKTRNIFKTLAFAMMMPAMLLTTACSSEDELANNKNIDNTEATINKGFSLPVTVSATRQGDSDMRAAYTDNGDGTGSLAFSAGDKLFVEGRDKDGAEYFAGALDYVPATGKFTGTIYTQNEWLGTADELFEAANADNFVYATLLPAGYKDHGYLYIDTDDPDAQYDDYINESYEYTLATSKADGVAQFSLEYSDNYNNGFALSPDNAILNFTITGLAVSTSVNVSLTSSKYNITGTVTTDASGNATFAAGISGSFNLKYLSLTVAGNPVTLVSSDKVVAKGKIYNITRSVLIVNPVVGQVIGDNGKNYANAAAAEADGATAVAKICYVGSDNGEAAPYNHGLALALSDANGGSTCQWSTEFTNVHGYKPTSSSFASESGLQYNAIQNSDAYPAFKAAIANNGTAAPTGCSAWFLASGYQWQKMAGAVGGLNNLGLQGGAFYWSSSEYNPYFSAWSFNSGSGNWYNDYKNSAYRVRACLAF